MTPDATAPSDKSPGDLSPGATFGAYRINRLLGRGGMGAVYEAVHQTDGRVVALKLLSVDLDQMDARQRFLREGQTAAAINHPNAVYIYGTEEINGTPVISMELVPGGTLEEKVKERGPLPVADAVEDIIQVIDGLDAALAAGVLHRDVKPANCFINADGVVKIGDFGLSKPVDGEEQMKLTRTGVFLGTPVFSSPEQLLGETLDVRSDIYAVGVTFYYLLTGQLPYSSGSMMQVVAAVLNGAPTPLHSLRADLPQNVVDVVMKAIARKTADRYQSYDEFRAAVAGLRAPEITPATLWDRFRAGVVDAVVVAAIVWVMLTLSASITGNVIVSSSPLGLKLNLLLGCVMTLIIIAIPEGLRGASIGKWLVGIRVAGLDGEIPGLPRAAARVLLLESIAAAGVAAQLMPTTATTRALAVFSANVGLRALLFVTVRRANGWRMLQDFATGTRVIRRAPDALKRHGEMQRREAPALTGSERHMGPYAVVGALREGSAVLLGWDESMQRSVWIVPQRANAPEIAQARRDLARLTRLRWVAGRRSGDDCWDAYESPFGEPLSARLQRAVPWSVQQEWVLDLTSELMAAERDGTLPAALSADALWVNAADRIVVPESAGAAVAGSTAAPLTLVAQLLELLRAANKGHAPLPRYAMRALAAAHTAGSVDEIHALFKETVGRPVESSHVRRSGLIGATIFVVLVVPVLSIVPIRQQSKSDPAGRTLSGLLQFIGDSAHALPVAERPKTPKKRGNLMTSLNGALQKAGWFTTDSALDRLSPEEYKEQSHLAQVYVAAVLASRVRDTTTTSVFGRSPPEARLARDILKLYPTVDSTELRAARVLVDSTWHGDPPGAGLDLLVKVVAAILFVFLPWFFAGCAIVIAVFARRGLLMRGFQVDIVTKDGEPAGRARIFLRNVVTWLPVSAPIVMYLAVDAAPPAAAAFALIASAAAVALLTATAIWIGIRTPARGIADRVAGTYLVPE